MTISKARIAADLLGVDIGGGELERLTITYETAPSDPIRALFNPNEISLSRSLQWEQQRQLGLGGEAPSGTRARFRYVEAETFSIELFFDTYESRRDVRRHTEQLAALTVVNPHLHRPPICQLRWGAFDIFTGVLTSLAQRFTLFLEDGTPVRATVSCSFLESVPTGRAGRARVALGRCHQGPPSAAGRHAPERRRRGVQRSPPLAGHRHRQPHRQPASAGTGNGADDPEAAELMPASDVLDASIRINDTRLPPEAWSDVRSLSVQEDLDAISMFALELYNWDDRLLTFPWSESPLFAVGNEVEISLGYVDDLHPVMVAEIISLEPRFASGELPMLTVRGYDHRHRLARGRNTRVFQQMADSAIAEQVAAGGWAELLCHRDGHQAQLRVAEQPERPGLPAASGATHRLRGLRTRQGPLLPAPAAHRGATVTLEFGEEITEFSPRLSSQSQVENWRFAAGT